MQPATSTATQRHGVAPHPRLTPVPASGGGDADRITDATRHVCAGIYEDRLFGARVYRLLLDDDHHAVGPGAGVDLRAIAQHAVAAREFALREDFAITIAAAIGLAGLIAEVPLVVFVAAVVVFGVAIYRTWNAQYGARAKLVKRGHFVADPLAGRYSRREQAQLDRIETAQHGNAVVYSGFSPFLGSGIELSGWSFTVDLTKGKEDGGGSRLVPQPVEVAAIHRHVDAALRETGLAGLELRDYVFVNGRDIRDDRRFLTDIFEPPTSSLSSEDVDAIVENPGTKTRHYKCVRIVEWDGELVLSAFFRFALAGTSLFAETSFWLLTPVHDHYRAIDNRADRPTFRQILQLVGGSAVTAPFLALFAPFALLERATGPWRRWRAERALRKQIREQPLYDYGARGSVREMAASGQYSRYFQKLDKEMFYKLTQRAILDALAEYLDAHDIDTSDLSERRTTIFNSGVIVSGGTVQTDTMTVGQGAKTFGARLSARLQPEKK